MNWKKIIAILAGVALVAALTTLLTIALGILVTSRGDGSPGASKEDLIENQKETVEEEVKVIESKDDDLASKDKILKDKIKDVNEDSDENKKEVQDDVNKIESADGLDELLHIQAELSKRNRDR